MKKLLMISAACTAALVAPTAWAADEERDVEAFTAVHVAVPFDVEFVVADEHYVHFEGDEETINEIETEVKGDTLKIFKDRSWFDWSDDNVLITIGYTELEGITLSGSGNGFAESIESGDFKMRITGSASMEVG